MKPQNLSELSDQEILQQIKKIKNTKLIDATLVGLTIGVVVYSATVNGFDFFTFFPLVITYVIVRNSANTKILENELQRELESRNSGLK
jgi:hypothetical protein